MDAGRAGWIGGVALACTTQLSYTSTDTSIRYNTYWIRGYAFSQKKTY
jgi:hypothetical protein